MADEFQLGSGNWWDSSRNRFDTASSSSASTQTPINSTMNSNLQMMGLGLSSQGIDWNQSLLRSEKGMLQEGTNFQQEAGGASSQDRWPGPNSSIMNDFKLINRGTFPLEQPEFNCQVSSNHSSTSTKISQGLATANFQMDSAAYGMLLSENQEAMNYAGEYPPSYGTNSGDSLPSWSKFPPFLKASTPKQPSSGNIHFTNNTPFWNASAATMNDVRPSFFPSLQPQLPPPAFDEKPKINTMEAQDIGTISKKNATESSNKRPRNETPTPLPAVKVRKEKMGDRVTALQQLVSPFGKTDTASVLSEAIEYIKLLHDQVSVLSSPYMKSGAPILHQQQNSDKSKDTDQEPAQDLKTRGLCLVPVSSTFPMTHEPTVDFWNPTFGGTYG